MNVTVVAGSLDAKGINNMDVNITKSNLGFILLCAIRYCLGRHTYAPVVVQGIVLDNISLINNGDLSIMIEDIEEARDRDNLGDKNINKSNWLAFLEALKSEQEGRKK